jgi:transcriptional regulator with XRE-family HTH domain
MAGRHKWSEIEAMAAPETIRAAETKAERTLASLRLGQLRKARGLTQEQIADRLEIRQVSVSRLEARDDVRVSTLRSVVEAMGGALDVLARFPDAAYRIAFDNGESDALVERVESLPAAARGYPTGPIKLTFRQSQTDKKRRVTTFVDLTLAQDAA